MDLDFNDSVSAYQPLRDRNDCNNFLKHYKLALLEKIVVIVEMRDFVIDILFRILVLAFPYKHVNIVCVDDEYDGSLAIWSFPDSSHYAVFLTEPIIDNEEIEFLFTKIDVEHEML